MLINISRLFLLIFIVSIAALSLFFVVGQTWTVFTLLAFFLYVLSFGLLFYIIIKLLIWRQAIKYFYFVAFLSFLIIYLAEISSSIKLVSDLLDKRFLINPPFLYGWTFFLIPLLLTYCSFTIVIYQKNIDDVIEKWLFLLVGGFFVACFMLFREIYSVWTSFNALLYFGSLFFLLAAAMPLLFLLLKEKILSNIKVFSNSVLYFLFLVGLIGTGTVLSIVVLPINDIQDSFWGYAILSIPMVLITFLLAAIFLKGILSLKKHYNNVLAISLLLFFGSVAPTMINLTIISFYFPFIIVIMPLIFLIIASMLFEIDILSGKKLINSGEANYQTN